MSWATSVLSCFRGLFVSFQASFLTCCVSSFQFDSVPVVKVSEHEDEDGSDRSAVGLLPAVPCGAGQRQAKVRSVRTRRVDLDQDL